jgi:hypothetical protein
MAEKPNKSLQGRLTRQPILLSQNRLAPPTPLSSGVRSCPLMEYYVWPLLNAKNAEQRSALSRRSVLDVVAPLQSYIRPRIPCSRSDVL